MISAPICSQIVRIPARVGLIPTFLIRSSDSGTNSPAAIKYAAEEMSPGTMIFCPYNSSQGKTEAVACPSFSLLAETRAPKQFNINSVWLRDNTGSVTEVTSSA